MLRAFVLVLCLGSAAADAQEQAQQTAPAEADSAREWYRAGVALYDRGEHGPALDAFRRAFALVPRPQLHFNMARCLSRLGRHREAVEEFQNAIESEELTDEERTRARAELLVERQKLGTVTIAGSGVATVDGEACEMPCRLLVEPGERRIEHEGRVEVVRVEEEEVVELDFTPRPIEPARRGPYRPGVGTAIGASLIALGAGGTIGFGLRTRSLEDDFDRNPTDALADDGEQAKLLTNVSIGVAVVGALVWLTEILVGTLRVREAEHDDDVARGVHPSAW